MTSKTKISITSILALFLVVAGVAVAYNQSCVTPEAQLFREAVQTGNPQDPAIQAKLAGLPILEREEARICALQKLTPEEISAIVARKKSMSGTTTPPGGAPLSDVVLGIQEAINPTYLKQEGLLPGTNSWAGYVNGKFTVVTGSAKIDNPSQGALFIMNDFNPRGSQVIFAPTATGPLKIISEENGTLTLQSVAGTYEVFDEDTNTRQEVTTKGGTTYTFNLVSRTFK